MEGIRKHYFSYHQQKIYQLWFYAMFPTVQKTVAPLLWILSGNTWYSSTTSSEILAIITVYGECGIYPFTISFCIANDKRFSLFRFDKKV